MQLTTGVQEALIALLCYDSTDRGAKLVRTLVTPKIFDPYFRDIAALAFNYFDQYKQVPGEHTLDLFDVLKARNEDTAEIYDTVFESLQTTKETINREWVISQASIFSRSQRLKRAVASAVEALELETEAGISECESALTSGLKHSYDLFNPGLFLHDTKNSLAFLDKQEDFWPVGVKELDALGICPSRKRIHILMGLYGKGKTHWLIGCVGKRALMHRAKVCHITLEVDEDEVAQRYMQALFSVTKRPGGVQYKEFEHDELGTFASMNEVEIKDRPSLRDSDIRSHLTSEIKKKERLAKSLCIKQFPTGSLTVKELETYLDGLEAAKGFIPDVLIVDYPDIMFVDPANERASLSAIYKDLRGLAVRRNIAVAVVTQSNREGEGAKVLGGKQVTGDFSKLATADFVITYNQTDDEHDMGLARLFVLKSRTEKDRFTILISQAYSMGQFCIDSVLMQSKKYWAAVKDETGDKGDDNDE